MAKILYGICGEGLGHASRSRILINHLKKKHDICIVCGGKAYPYMKNFFKNVNYVESPHFVYKGNEIRLFFTIFRLIFITILKTPYYYIKIRKIIKKFNPNILITDAEPISFYASYTKNIKRISIDNPQAILHQNYKINSGEYFSWLFLYITLKISFINSDKYIIYDFTDKKTDNSKVLYLKPLIQEGILKQKPKIGNHIFVYQTSISTKFITKILKKIDEKFIIYGYNKDFVDGNLVYKQFNEDEFYHDISSAKAVLTNGGFTVISEALYLKKPIFSVPINNQFEQVINGQFVEQLGVGVTHTNLNEENLKDFLDNLESYKENLKSYDPGCQNQILNRIEDEIQSLLSTD